MRLTRELLLRCNHHSGQGKRRKELVKKKKDYVGEEIPSNEWLIPGMCHKRLFCNSCVLNS